MVLTSFPVSEREMKKEKTMISKSSRGKKTTSRSRAAECQMEEEGRLRRTMHIIFGLSGCLWHIWGAVPVLGPCISLYWQSLPWWLQQIFPLYCRGEGERSVLHLSIPVDLSKELHHIRTGRRFRGRMSQSGGTWKIRRLRRAQGTHSVTSRVQNRSPGLLRIRLEALAIIWRWISLVVARPLD